MKKFNITDVKVSDKNRFSKYYNSVEESGLKSDIDKNFAPKGHISLSSLHRIKITETICKKLSSKYKYLKHLRVQDNTLGYFFLKDSSSDEIVSTIMVETKSDGTKWIQALEINSRYQGYGLGKQTLNYACKTMGAKYLSVYKDNKIAFEMYKKYGFRIYDETQYMYMMTIDNSKKEFALCNESMTQIFIHNEDGSLVQESLDNFIKYARDIHMYKVYQTDSNINALMESSIDNMITEEVDCLANKLINIRDSIGATITESIDNIGIEPVPILSLNESIEDTNVRYYRDLNGVYIKNINTGFRSKSFESENEISDLLIRQISESVL